MIGMTDLKIAVIMWGALRTWNLCKDIILAQLERFKPESKDWFISTYESNTCTSNEIRKYLESQNQNVIWIKYLPEHQNHYMYRYTKYGRDEMVNPSEMYLGKLFLIREATFKKRVYEFLNNINYDILFYICPDVIFSMTELELEMINNLFEKRIFNFSFGVRGDYTDNYTFGGVTTNDLLIITGKYASDILGFQYYDLNYSLGEIQKIYTRLGNCAHSLLPNYFLNHNIRYLGVTDHLDKPIIDLKTYLVRPNTTDICNFNIFNFHKNRQEYRGYCINNGKDIEEWDKFSKEQKKELCIKLNIDPRDYKCA